MKFEVDRRDAVGMPLAVVKLVVVCISIGLLVRDGSGRHWPVKVVVLLLEFGRKDTSSDLPASFAIEQDKGRKGKKEVWILNYFVWSDY
ncbi:hypothetical protein GN958_ATG14418 [Phytophthora infestans]|uniref:Uncharacterized protein n=1 Tax=Phytophthora infestans TaxID=4787 RepID=A0A8S9UBP1_PHYIN|nr:hypothetical protein GN958_ATG14418 [Phytophthora infestans]